ncbi:MAG: class I SAM-dependent methyltransferase [Candidatus Aenigmarchaeota archaeon]|nr:class I SAM-dependent methyltransferase [Candidatus Aenigmarchaeota archaeon]
MQWTKTPCGSSEIYCKEGTKEYFDAVQKQRYLLYAPWLLEYIRSIDAKGKKVLEIGCGLGTDLMEFSKQGAQCYGIDLTPKHVSLAKKRFKLNNISPNIYQMDATKLKFKNDFFDIVYSHGVLHHIPSIELSLKEIYRVLRKRGKAHLMVYHKRSLDYYKILGYYGILRGQLLKKGIDGILSEVIEANSKETKPHVKVYSMHEFNHLLESAGFEVKKMYANHILDEKRSALLRKVIPENLFKGIGRKFGWYLIAEAIKNDDSIRCKP